MNISLKKNTWKHSKDREMSADKVLRESGITPVDCHAIAWQGDAANVRLAEEQ